MKVKDFKVRKQLEFKNLFCKVTQKISLYTELNRDELFQWLSITDSSVDHDNARIKHEPETGNWFIHGVEYLQWKQTPGSFLWVHGIPGSGKTILW